MPITQCVSARVITDGVIVLADADEDQFGLFHAMEQDPDTNPYITAYSVDEHHREFERDDVVYKSVYNDDGDLVGFVILILDADQLSVELRRIVIAQRGKSYGSRALALIERVCELELDRQRIWLDVFDFNPRARHVYENGGYRMFGTSKYQDKVLQLYEKEI